MGESEAEQLARLPSAVRRHLEIAGVVGRPMIRSLRVRERGWMRLSEEKAPIPFTAVQQFSTEPPSFVWSARMQLFPFVRLSVSDAFSGEHGALRVKLFGVLPVTDARGPEVDEGELQRYLAESTLFPTLWLSPMLTWEAGAEACCAVATLTHRGKAVSAVFHFGEDGFAQSMQTDRYATVGKLFVKQPWSGRSSDYREVGGIQVPAAFEALWRPGPAEFCYFKATISAFAFSYAEPSKGA